MVNKMIDIINKIYEDHKDIKYAWRDKNGEIHNHISEGYVQKFRMQEPEEVLENNCGNCWETVELTRYLLKQNKIPCKTYFFVIPMHKFYCHSIAVAEYNNKFYWIENSFRQLKGVREYNTLDELFNHLLDNFHYVVNSDNVKYNTIKIYEYKKPPKHIGCVKFYYYCFRSENITNPYIPNYIKSIEDKNQK